MSTSRIERQSQTRSTYNRSALDTTAILPAALMTKLEHATLGELTGLDRGNDIVQFRGIPYASIPARFRQSVLCTGLPTRPFDATQTGYTPILYWRRNTD